MPPERAPCMFGMAPRDATGDAGESAAESSTFPESWRTYCDQLGNHHPLSREDLPWVGDELLDLQHISMYLLLDAWGCSSLLVPWGTMVSHGKLAVWWV